MKKKIVTILLATSLVMSTFVGCSSEDAAATASSAVSSEASSEAASEASSEVASEASSEAASEASSEAASEASSEAAESSVASQDGDWSTAYDDYFERENIMSDKVKTTATTSAEGVEFSIAFAIADENSYLSIDFDTAALDIYFTPEKMYACTKMEGQEAWTYAPVTAETDTDSMVSVGESSFLDVESVQSFSYAEEVVEDGVVYDTLDAVVVNEDSTIDGTFYINRETQKIEKYTFEQDGAEVVCHLEEIDSIEIPAAAQSGTEVTQDEIAMSIFGVMMAGMSSYMEMPQ